MIVNDKSAVMYGAVVRGDLAVIRVGLHVTIGENATLSAGEVEDAVSRGEAIAGGMSLEPQLFVGDYSVVGANASLRGCFLEGDNVVGSCAFVGDGARLGRYAEILAGGVVGNGVEVGEGEIWGGSPARKVGLVDEDERVERRKTAERSFGWMQRHAYEFLPVGTVYWEKERLEEES